MGEIIYYLFGLESDSYLVRFFKELGDEWGNTYADLLHYETNNAMLYLAIAMVIASVAMTYMYYYVIDHPRFCKLVHWMLWMIITFFVIFGIAFWIAQEMSYSEFGRMITNPEIEPLLAGVDTDISLHEYTLNLALTVGLYGLLFACVASFLIRFKSINCRKTPF